MRESIKVIKRAVTINCTMEKYSEQKCMNTKSPRNILLTSVRYDGSDIEIRDHIWTQNIPPFKDFNVGDELSIVCSVGIYKGNADVGKLTILDLRNFNKRNK